MDDVLQGVQQEMRQSVKQQVKSETREVLAEEQVIPSRGLGGLYAGTDSGGSDILCNFSIGTSTFQGTCTSSNDNNRAEVSGTISGSSITFSFTIFDFNPVCTGQGTGTGEFVGAGETGTLLHLHVSGTECDTNPTPDNFTLTKQ